MLRMTKNQIILYAQDDKNQIILYAQDDKKQIILYAQSAIFPSFSALLSFFS